MDDNSLMPFGKYKNEKMRDVPAWYLLGLLKAGKCYGKLQKYLEDNETVLTKEMEETNPEDLSEIDMY